MFKKRILNIDYRQELGMVLEWNYSDLSLHSKFYRHILLLFSNQTQKAQQFVEEYIKRIKPGDLYLTLYTTHNHTLRCRNWREKLLKDSFQIQNYFCEQIRAKSKQLLIQKAKKQYSSYDQPMVLNVLVQNLSDVQYFSQVIQNNRVENNFQFICSLFGPFPHSQISVSRGLNMLSTTSQHLSSITSYYHKFINQTAFRYAILTINCHNGTIVSHNQEEWLNQSFNRIVRKFYGPSVLYDRDVLSFMNSNLAESGSYELTIQLKFVCFDGTSYESSKYLVIKFDQNHMHNLSMACKERSKTIYVDNGIELRKSPYSTATTIVFSKMNGTFQNIN